jgi:hypothetical protein
VKYSGGWQDIVGNLGFRVVVAVNIDSSSIKLLSLISQKKYIYRVSQEESARLWEGVPYGKVYRYNPKHLCPKLNGYEDNGQRKVWSSVGSTL